MLCVLQPHSILLLADILLDGIDDADVGGQLGSHCLELILAFNSCAAFGGPHSCSDVNRALSGSWLEPGQPPPRPAQRRKQQLHSLVCCGHMGSVGWSREYETPAQLAPRPLPGRECAVQGWMRCARQELGCWGSPGSCGRSRLRSRLNASCSSAALLRKSFMSSSLRPARSCDGQRQTT